METERDETTTAFLGGRIVTMDAHGTIATGLVARAGRIAQVGPAEELEAALPPEADVVPLEGRVVLPGFVDAHCHLELTTTHLHFEVNCFAPPHRSLADISAAVAARAAASKPGAWIVGRANFSLERWVEERRPLLRRDLDEAAPDNPVVVLSGLHVCTLNTRALTDTGLLDGQAPPRGASVDLESGRATELWDWLPLPSYEREAAAAVIRDLGRSLFQHRGVTSIGEIPFTLDGVQVFESLRDRGELPARLALWYHVPRLVPVHDIGRVRLEPSFEDEWLRLGGIKLFVDGAGVDVHGHAHSDLKWTQAELDEIVWRAHEAGLQLWMHVAPTAVAAAMALAALEKALDRLPRPDHRHRIEHLGDLYPDEEVRALLLRTRELGAIPVSTPQFVYSYGDTDSTSSCSPLRTLRSLGFRVPGNSDSTGTQPEAANPFHGIWCAVTHRTRDGRVVAPEERVDLEAAIRGYTADAAYACHMDDRGTLEPGKLADLVVLADDPWTLPVDDLPDVRIDMTVVGGRVAWARGDA